MRTVRCNGRLLGEEVSARGGGGLPKGVCLGVGVCPGGVVVCIPACTEAEPLQKSALDFAF